MSDRTEAGDGHTPQRLIAACAWFNADLAIRPLRRGECLLIVSGLDVRRLLQHELGTELRQAGLSTLAKRVERTPILPEHVLAVCIGDEVAIFVVPLTADLHGGDVGPEPRSTALAVLGATAVGAGR